MEQEIFIFLTLTTILVPVVIFMKNERDEKFSRLIYAAHLPFNAVLMKYLMSVERTPKEVAIWLVATSIGWIVYYIIIFRQQDRLTSKDSAKNAGRKA